MRSHLAHLDDLGFGRLSTRPHRGKPCILNVTLTTIAVVLLLVTGVPARAADGAGALLTDAITLMETGACDAALPLFERIEVNHPDAPEVPVALYNRGLCHERLGDLAAADRVYSRIVARHRRSLPFPDALFRRGLARAALGDTRPAQRDFRRLRRRLAGPAGRLTSPRERAVLDLQLGACQAALERPAAGTRLVLPALEVLETIDPVEDPDVNWYVAQSHVVLGDILADGMQRVSLDTADGSLQRERLSRRLELFQEARDHYQSTLRYDAPLWICAAGYKLGRLHETSRDALLAAPSPSLLTDDQARLYRAELERRTADYLSTAAGLYRETLRFASMAHVDNRWVELARERLDRLEIDPLLDDRDL